MAFTDEEMLAFIRALGGHSTEAPLLRKASPGLLRALAGAAMPKIGPMTLENLINFAKRMMIELPSKGL